eukprot:Sdes_comp20001_c0_seq1m12641
MVGSYIISHCWVVFSKPGWTVETFLKRIKGGADKYIELFPTWESLFQQHGRSLTKLGVSTEHKKFILAMCNKFRLGMQPHPMPKRKSERKIIRNITRIRDRKKSKAARILARERELERGRQIRLEQSRLL